MKAINRIYRKLTSRLRDKLMFIYICILVIPLAISTYVTYNRFSQEIESTYIENNLLLVHQLNRQLDDYLKEIDQFALSLYTMDLLGDFEEGPNKSKKDSERLVLLSLLHTQKKEINSILFYRPMLKEAYYVDRTNVKIFYNTDKLEEESWYQRLLRNNGVAGNLQLIPTHTASLPANFNIQDKPEVFSVQRTFTHNLMSQVYGVLSMNVNLDYMMKVMFETVGSDDESVVFLNKAGELYYNSATQPNRPGKDEIYKKINQLPEANGHLIYSDASEEQWMIIYNKSDFFGNIVYKILPLNNLHEQAAYVKNFNIAILIIAAIFLVLASIIITYKITKPLFELERSMKRAGEGDFKSFSQVTTSDEIGRISIIHNKMLNKINVLITDKYIMELDYRMAQLKTLQAQINPHFLYNTLQSIGSVALQEGLRDLHKMTNALSNYLRYSIKSGGDTVELDEELTNTEQYLLIQKFRYEEKLNYEIYADEDMRTILIPKLTLQPIVENAIIHGLEHKKGSGLVMVQCIRVDNQLQVIVRDDGVGMDSAELLRVQTELLSEEHSVVDHIGLKNVLQRLKLALGDRCSMKITSKLGEGTTIIIHIPITLMNRT
jgi:two-component system sensor histidine kinase YesM